MIKKMFFRPVWMLQKARGNYDTIDNLAMLLAIRRVGDPYNQYLKY